jgi:hypothetical protein
MVAWGRATEAGDGKPNLISINVARKTKHPIAMMILVALFNLTLREDGGGI